MEILSWNVAQSGDDCRMMNSGGRIQECCGKMKSSQLSEEQLRCASWSRFYFLPQQDFCEKYRIFKNCVEYCLLFQIPYNL